MMNLDDDDDTLNNFASSHVIAVSTAIKSFPDMLCWLKLRQRWAHQIQREQIADCFDKQPVPTFSCNDINFLLWTIHVRKQQLTLVAFHGDLMMAFQTKTFTQFRDICLTLHSQVLYDDGHSRR